LLKDLVWWVSIKQNADGIQYKDSSGFNRLHWLPTIKL